MKVSWVKWLEFSKIQRSLRSFSPNLFKLGTRRLSTQPCPAAFSGMRGRMSFFSMWRPKDRPNRLRGIGILF